MVIIQAKPKRKPSGARYTCTRTKRIHQKGSLPTNTRIGEKDTRTLRTKGGSPKTKLLFADKLNLLDPSTRKCSVENIKTVLESPANRHFVRRNILTKGTIVETSKGKARITSQPGQDSMINAILVK